MKTKVNAFGSALLSLAIGISGATPAQAQVQARITAAVDSGSRSTIPGSRPNSAAAADDAGRVPNSTTFQGVSISFSRTDAQEASLQSLIAAQQNSSSPLYHQWLTPEQFAARFGAATSDIAKVEAWLQYQGLTVQGVSRSRSRLTFSGTVGQLEAAFGTEIHYYKSGTETHFAPSGNVSIPSAFAGAIQNVSNLSNFHPRPQLISRRLTPEYTSSVSGAHLLTPKDVATIYDMTPAYNAGFTGTGQSIAIMGESAINTADITAFESAAGLTAKLPTLVLMPNTGTSTVVAGDESESDIDLEYSSGTAPGANIFFVYTGNSSNNGVFDALQYAVDEKIAPIISISYGDCETDLGSAFYAQFNAYLAQAATQGQTVISSAGDSGSTGCAGYDNSSPALTLAQQQADIVNFPASSQYVTAMGGTGFPAADVAVGNTQFWAAQGTTDVVSSALSYIPETVWNDESYLASLSTPYYALSAGGGGSSVFTARPTWQTGVTGIASGNFRLVPDISLASSPYLTGYLFCTSDTSFWVTGQVASCNNGFRDASTKDLTEAGGTSFAAPIFAGMLAVINQARHVSTGQGVVNPTLYSLAANATTYASAFHDITVGSNACTANATYNITDNAGAAITFACTTASAAGFAANTGYDEATGLGSVDFYKLMTAWPSTTASSLAASTISITAANTNPAVGASDLVTIAVTSASSSTVAATGTVNLVVDGTTINSALALSGGVATYTFASSTAGSHIVTATYSGDGTYAPSTGTLVITIGSNSTSAAAFTVSATSITVAAGGTGTSTVTLTPSGGYVGTVTWQVGSATSVPNSCYSIANLPVTGTTAVTTTLTIATSSASCGTAAVVTGSGQVRQPIPKIGIAFSRAPHQPLRSLPYGVALAGVFAFGFLKRRLRNGCSLLALSVLAILGLGLSGCSTSSSTATSTAVAAKGSYTLTLVGTDTTTSSVTASTTLTLTID